MRNFRLVYIVVGAAGACTVDACVGDSSVVMDGGPDVTTSDVAVDTANDTANDAPVTGPINGTVLAIDGTPFKTKVEANGQVTTTDPTTGAFTLPDPGPSYTITFIYGESNITLPVGFVYQGMTRRNPVLMIPIRIFQDTITVSGTVLGALPTISGSRNARLVFAPNDVVGNNGTYLTDVADGGSFAPTQMSFPNQSQTGTLYFIEKDFNSDAGNTIGTGTGYPMVGSISNVGFANNATLDEVFDAAAAASIGNVTGSVTSPTSGSWTVGKTSLSAIFGGTTPVELDGVGPQVSTFSFVAPNINGANLVVDTSATTSAGASSSAWNTGFTTNTTGISLKLPNVPEVASPAQNTTVPLATTQFVYNSVQGVAYATLQCFVAGGDGGPGSVNYRVHVITTATNVTAPQDAPLSLGLPPSGSTCAFTVGSLSSYTAVDQAAGPGGYANAFSADYATVNGAFGLSAPQNVTAQ